ncbi:ankyrin repeat domain-containing protein [Montanilutibacter psychrotolerans]|uniref:Ankyrin repeat domain-containing protein n=1 Tax=Montanilutibacter psychrotolerans TaxID=1327343 RepID=A0A3M8SZW9_9GAMM|nr:ankyrin repeat domain-containing protein [Lysobacter psychrotolerans]RNF86245.1 ankyrin repeat domain-containing protein [Lysobacter psychrotolerans]
MHKRQVGSSRSLLFCAAIALLAFPVILPANPPAAMVKAARYGDGGGPLLIAAVKAGRVDEIRALIGDGVDIDATVAGEGTALTTASRAGDLDIVNELLRLGADVNHATRGDGNPLIMAASRPGNLEVVERLVVAGSDVNAIVTDDETPLINAARSGDLRIVKYMVEHGANVELGVTVTLSSQARVWRSPLNQARTMAIRSYLIGQGARR